MLVYDNLSTGTRQNLAAANRRDLTLIQGDVADWEQLLGVFDSFGPEVVVHAAASYNDPDDWQRDVRTNTLGSANVVQAAQAVGCQRIIYLQTALCYGTDPQQQPVQLDYPLEPNSSYAISKTAAEQYIASSGLDYVSFRLANCYGPRNLSGPLPTFWKRLKAGEPLYVADTRRDFVYVDDLVDLLVLAVRGRGHGYYHASSGEDYAILELYEALVQAVGVDANPPPVRPRSPGDAYTILLDPRRTRQEFFGWEPRTPLQTGVARAVAHYEQAGVAETYTHLKIAT